MLAMAQSLISEIDAFVAELGLSEHRVGILLANNGRLIERLRAGRRVWPETEAAIRAAMTAERRKRAGQQPATTPSDAA